MIRTLLSLIALLALGLGGAIARDAPTPATDIDPHALFAAMKAASGGSHWEVVAQLDYEADAEQGGQQGRLSYSQDLRQGRFVTYDEIGGIAGGDGFDGRRSWLMDEKHLVSVRESVQTLRQAATDAYIARNGWFRSNDNDPASMQYLGEQREGARTFQRITVTPKDGMAFDAWIDARTHLLDSVIEHADDGSLQTTRFTDYRSTAGLLLPYEQRQGSGDTQYDMVLHMRSVLPQANVDNARFVIPTSEVRDAHILNGAASATVPFTSYADLILVDISIDGKPPLPFILDTGGLNLLTPQAAHLLGLTGAGNEPINGVGEAVQSVQNTQVQRYRVGPVELRDQHFLIVDLPVLVTDRGARTPVAGLIGYELLRRFVTRIDYDRKELTFTPNRLFHADDTQARLPIMFDERTPQINAQVDGVTGVFALDTGDSGNLTLFKPFADAHGIVLRGDIIKSQARGAGGKIAFNTGRLNTLTLGPYTIVHPRTDLAAPKSGAFASTLLGGNIGFGVLSRFVVTFDYDHRYLTLQKSAAFDAPPPPDRLGVGFDRLTHTSLQVATLRPKSTAAAAGLHVGDEVVAIDDVAVASLGLDDLHGLARRAVGTRVRLRVLRAGVAKDVSFVLRDLPN